MKTILLKILDHGRELPLPEYMTEHAAGMDIYAAINDEIVLLSGQRCLVPSGFSMALPVGIEAQIRPRSGLALRHGITVLNSPGTVDADYRGEIQILLINLGQEVFHISRGMRIAQIIFAPVYRAKLELIETLPESNRSKQGFGSTG